MKFIYILLIVIFSVSCSENNKNISINLNNASGDILYTQIVDRLDYLTLNTGDTCLLSGIERFFVDGDTLIIKDTKHEGVFVFTKNGDFIKQINYKGEGPQEYLKDNAVAVDTLGNCVYIYDMMSFKVNKYTYEGEFLLSEKIDFFIRDFAVVENKFLMIQPCINKVYKRSGAWISFLNGEIGKQLIDYSEDDQNFEFMSTYITITPHGVYYYDRNNDSFYIIRDTVIDKLYDIDLKQRIAKKAREYSNPNMRELEYKSMMFDFCISSKYILFNYFVFGEKNNPFKWALLDMKDGGMSIFNNLVDDIDNTTSFDNNKIFYVNDSTWCRQIDTEENNCNTILQFMYLK